jgi:hypothetical protein
MFARIPSIKYFADKFSTSLRLSTIWYNPRPIAVPARKLSAFIFIYYLNIKYTNMDAILAKFSQKIDAKKVIATVEDIERVYIADGLTKEDIPPIVAKLMMMAASLKKLPGPEKKRLVIGLLNYLIEQIDRGDEDSEFETMLKSVVPSIVDGFAGVMKLKGCIPCLK